MADILVKCSHCGSEVTVSEYAAADGLNCPECDHGLTLPHQNDEPSLRLRKSSLLGQPLLHEAAGHSAIPQRAAAHAGVGGLAQASSLEEVYRTRESVRGQRTILGWMLFLLVAGVMVLLQDTVRVNSDVMGTYTWVLGLFGGLIYLLVLVVAFEDSLWQGLLSLLVPPYCIYYVLVRLESHVLKCLFLALVVALATEVHFIPDQAVLNRVQPAVSNMISSGEQLIQRASDAPTFD